MNKHGKPYQLKGDLISALIQELRRLWFTWFTAAYCNALRKRAAECRQSLTFTREEEEEGVGGGGDTMHHASSKKN